MSEVKAGDITPITSPDDVFDLYAGAGQHNAKLGIEVELAFFNPDSDDLPVMSLCQNRVLKNAAAAAQPEEDWVHNEPTSELLEVASIAAPFDQIKTVMNDINDKQRILMEKAHGLGLKRSYFQELPDKTAQDLLSRIVDVERYNVMYAPYREDMTKCVEYFAVCKSNQVSVSPYSMDHMLENVRRLYILAPFLFLLTDNSTGYSEGRPFSGHIGMDLRYKGLTEGRGYIPPYVFTAQNGEEFVASHINHVMNNPLFMHYDLDGNLVRVPSGDWSVTFNSLRAQGLNIASNYYLAQSILWPDIKIAALKDNEGKVNGHRYEARMFGVGLHQHQTASIITGALAFDQSFALAVDSLLARYGFDVQDLTECEKNVHKAYSAARSHNGAFFGIAYGTGKMLDFARNFADLVEGMADAHDLYEDVQPLLTICRSGCTDGKVNRILFPTLEDIKRFQQHYDPALFEDPQQCAKMAFERDLSRISHSRGSSACCG